MSADEEDEWDDEDWDEDEPDEWEEEDADEDEAAAAREGGALPARSLALGILAMLPMLLVYELALAAQGGARRNTSELVLFRIFALLGDWADLARWLALAAAGIASFVWCTRREISLGPRLTAIFAQGVLGAIVIGPLLILLARLFGDALPAMGDGGRPGDRVPGLDQAAFVFGAGAYEELVFRVGAYSLLYTLAVRVWRFLGAGERLAGFGADLVGLLGSAALFSAFHLALFVSWLGPGGESFDSAVFLYRALAGILLGVVFRWRGPGVAAWTHGLYNLALLLGAGPHAFS